MPTITALVSTARARLRAAGVPEREAELDARLLAQHVLQWDAARLLASSHDEAPDAFAAGYERLVVRRCRREPMAYILGQQEFWGLTFGVDPAVLIPRPETELLVETALARLPSSAALRIADVGTGSGCVAVALAHERPHASVIASDVSAAALSLAAANAARHGVADRIVFLCADLLPHDTARAAFDLIVSNPPYVRDDERDTLPPEVRDHEPPSALYAGPHGLDVIRRLIAVSSSRLKPGGFLIFEIGSGQAEAVRGLIAATGGFTMFDVRCDLQGIPRTVVAQTRS